MIEFTPFGSGDDAAFDDEDSFVPEHLPEPGEFLLGHRVLTGEDHVDFHAIARECFEERAVYDMTFGYNLARLNRDPRHPDAGFRYAEHAADPSVLLAEFTPTTAFCPQSDTLTKGAFRALNGLADRHDYRAVHVRLDRMHHESAAINDELRTLQSELDAGPDDEDPSHAERVRERLAGPDGSDEPDVLR